MKEKMFSKIRTYYNRHNHMVWIFIGFILAVFYVTFSLNDYFSTFSEDTRKIMGNTFLTLAGAFIASGAFSAFLKALQFSGIFAQELEKIIYSETHLNVRTDRRQLWNRATVAMHENRFPDLFTEINEKLVSTYLPTQSDYYYEGYHRDIKIELTNEPYVIKITTHVQGNIVPKVNSKRIKFMYNHSGTSESTTKLAQINKLQICNKDYTKKIKQNVEKVDDFYRHRIRFIKKIKGLSKKNPLDMSMTTYQNILEDPIIQFECFSYCNGMTLNVHYPNDKLRVVFSPIGASSFKKYGDSSVTGVIKRKYEGLLFFRQGFMLFIQEASY